MQDSFSADELVIRRDDYAEKLREKLEKEITSSDFLEDEDDEENPINVTDKASFIIRKLAKCGWVTLDRIENKFEYSIYINDYAQDILNTFRSLSQDNSDKLSRSISSSYLQLAGAKKDDEKLVAMESAYDNFHSFEKELIKIFSNIKRYHEESSEIDNVNDLLSQFLRNYQKNIDRKYISPLSQSNSVERYRNAIKEIFSKYMTVDFENLKLAWAEKHSQKDMSLDVALEKAEREIIDMITYSENMLDRKFPYVVSRIKEKDSTYKERTIERIKNKSRSGKNVKKALLDIIKASRDNDALLDEMSSSLSLSNVKVYDKNSIYLRREKNDRAEGEELTISRRSRDDEVLEALYSEFRDQIANEEIDSFVLGTMKERDEIRSEDFVIVTIREFILFILSSIRSQEKDSPYSIERMEGYVDVMGNVLPNLIFRIKHA